MEQFNTIPTSGNWSDIAGILDANFFRCYTALVQSESLVGLSGSNFQGIYTSASALPDEMSSSGWALVGSSLSALTLYVYNTSSSEWGALNNVTYNFTDFSEFQNQLDALSSQLTQIGLKIGNLAELETEEKTNLVGAINELDGNIGGIATDTNTLVQKAELYDSALANCIHSGDGTTTTTVTFSSYTSFANQDQAFAPASMRIVLKASELVNVSQATSVVLYIPYSVVSSDSKIDRCSMPLYDSNKTYLGSLDLGWTYFNGSAATISVDLTSTTYAGLVSYVGCYFGSLNNANISPSSLNVTGLTFTLTLGQQYTTRAVDEDMLEAAITEGITKQTVVVSSITDYISGLLVSRIRYHIWFAIPKGLLRIKLTADASSAYHYSIKFLDEPIENNFVYGPFWKDSGWIDNGTAEFIVNNVNKYVAITFGKRRNGKFTAADAVTEMGTMTFSVEKVKEDYCSLFRGGIPMVAHRGTFFLGAPENSVPAFMMARRLGYQYIECDVRVTSDGEYVIMHDESINRTCVTSSNTSISSTVNVASVTLSTLRDNYLLASDNPAYRTKIPTLEEYLIACKGGDSIAMVELEPMTNAQAHGVYDLCLQYLGKGKFAFNSANYGLLDYIRTIDSDVELFYETTSILNTTNTIDGRSRNDVNNVWYAEYSGYYGTLDSSAIQQYHALGMKVFCWTVPSSEMENLLAIGIDGVATNDIPPQMLGATATCERFNFFDLGNLMTSGDVQDGIITMASGDFLQLPNHNSGFGAKCIRITAKGDYTVTTNTKTFTDSFTSTESVFSKTFSDSTMASHELYMMYYCDKVIASSTTNMPNLIIAANGSVEIYSIEYYDVSL